MPKKGNGALLEQDIELDSEAAVEADLLGAKGKGKKAGPAKIDFKSITIPKIQTDTMEITVVETTPLIVNNFSEKSKGAMFIKQTKGAAVKREAKNPFEQFTGSLYVMPGKSLPKTKLEKFTNEQHLGDSWPYLKDTFGIPSPALKNAMISACRFIDGVPMTLVTGAVHVLGFTLPIKYSKLYMREDIVRVGKFPNKQPDLRYRAMFTGWSITARVMFNSRIFKPEQIVNLIQHAGFHVGLCEWRVEKKGSFGMFEVERG